MEALNVNNGNKYKKAGFWQATGALTLGAVAGNSTVGLLHQPVAKMVVNKLGKLSNQVTADEFRQIDNSVKTLLNSTGLAAKGVGIQTLAPGFTNNLLKDAKIPLLQKIGVKLSKGLLLLTEQGFNAAFATNCKLLPEVLRNKILMGENSKMGLAIFHEMGHAMNANMSKVGKILVKSKMVAPVIALATILSVLFKGKKAEGEKATGWFDKTTDFLRNHAGKLIFLSFVPMLLEEGLASIKGYQLAKQVLKPDLLSKVAKTNKIAYLSYASFAALSVVGIAVTRAIRDKLAPHKKVA